MGVKLYHGDNLDIFPLIEDESVNTVITDPPYGYQFMSKSWDHGVPGVRYWAECLRVSKPGAMLCAFGGTRTHHRLMCAIEDAGWEIRDVLMWLYGSGFPKSHDVSKAIDKVNGEAGRLLKFTRWFRTTGVTRQQATDVMIAAGHISENGTMAGHYFAKSLVGQPAMPTCSIWETLRLLCDDVPDWVDELVERIEAEREVIGHSDNQIHLASLGNAGYKEEWDITSPATDAAALWDGYGTALKPAYEPIILAMKPLPGTFAQNALGYGVAGLWVDGCRVGMANEADRTEAENKNRHADFGSGPRGNEVFGADDRTRANQGNYNRAKGRWPANLLLSHAPGCDENCVPECPVRLLDEQSGEGRAGKPSRTGTAFLNDGLFMPGQNRELVSYEETAVSGASRFFTRFHYSAKASRAERELGLLGHIPCLKCGELDSVTHFNPKTGKEEKCRRNNHPTVKPLDVCRWLCRLTKTPTGGVVLDPFMGSGRIPMAASLEGRDTIGIELERPSFEIAQAAVQWAQEQVPEMVQAEMVV